MVPERGSAAAYPKYCAELVFYQTQENAQAHRRGIWQQDGEQQRRWDWRKSDRNKRTY